MRRQKDETAREAAELAKVEGLKQEAAERARIHLLLARIEFIQPPVPE